MKKEVSVEVPHENLKAFIIRVLSYSASPD